MSLDEIKKYLELDMDIKFINDGVGYEIKESNGGLIIHYEAIRDAFRALIAYKLNMPREGRSCFNELGFMVDLSRNAILNMETMKRLIRILSIMGYNQLYLYMEDTYEVDDEPCFGLYRGRYSKDEMKKIDAYASLYGIEVIPCIQTLAHLGGIFEWDCYKDIKDIDNILLVKDDKTYSLITNMIKTLRECFKTNKLHIGMDEAHNLGLGKYLDRYGYSDRFEIMDYHIKRVNEICKKYSFKPMIWSDMFFRLAFHGNYYSNNEVSEEDLAKIPNDIELVYWDYYKTNKNDYDNMIRKHRMITNEIRFAGGAWKWMGFAANNRFSLKASSEAIKALIANDIKNVMVTAWGDDGAEASIFSCLPTMLYYSECNYSGYVDLNSDILKEKFKLLFRSNLDDFINTDIINEPSGKMVDTFYPNPSKYLLYNDILSPKFDHYVKYGYCGYYNQANNKLMAMSERNKPFSYMFITLAKLAGILALKAELGLDLYNHYSSRDIDSLKDDVVVIESVILSTEEFYEAFKHQWLKENKSYGFDVESIRIGGLIYRLKYAKERLEDYIAGRIDKIEELEEKRILKSTTDSDIDYNQWATIVTANKLLFM